MTAKEFAAKIRRLRPAVGHEPIADDGKELVPCTRCPSYMAFGPCGCSGDGALDMRFALLRILIEEDNEVFG